ARATPYHAVLGPARRRSRGACCSGRLASAGAPKRRQRRQRARWSPSRQRVVQGVWPRRLGENKGRDGTEHVGHRRASAPDVRDPVRSAEALPDGGSRTGNECCPQLHEETIRVKERQCNVEMIALRQAKIVDRSKPKQEAVR